MANAMTGLTSALYAFNEELTEISTTFGRHAMLEYREARAVRHLVHSAACTQQEAIFDVVTHAAKAADDYLELLEVFRDQHAVTTALRIDAVESATAPIALLLDIEADATVELVFEQLYKDVAYVTDSNVATIRREAQAPVNIQLNR